MPTTAELRDVLSRARDLIADKERWAQGDYAFTADGEKTTPTAPEACRWCAVGAILKVTDSDDCFDDVLATNAVLALAETCGLVYDVGESAVDVVAEVNDHAGYEAVLGAFDRKLASLEKA